MDVRVALVTAPDESSAKRMADTLVEERLAACVNILPGLTSVYRWESAVHSENEVLLLIKTQASRVAELERRLVELHPYEVPEFLVLSVGTGLPSYLEWVASETTRPEDR